MKKEEMRFKITFTRKPVQYFFVMSLLLVNIVMLLSLFYFRWFTDDFDKYNSETESYEARVSEWEDSVITAKFILVGKIPEKTFVMRRITSPNIGTNYVYDKVKASRYVTREIGDTCELTGSEKGISYYIEDKGGTEHPGKPKRKTENPHLGFEIITVIVSIVIFLLIGFIGFDEIPRNIQLGKETRYWWFWVIGYFILLAIGVIYSLFL